ncbi:Testis-expressed protein 30 [Actinomortierella ambigua]|nr:Testis-expressed protein 30 [Actinomortierella ambigua]
MGTRVAGTVAADLYNAGSKSTGGAKKATAKKTKSKADSTTEGASVEGAGGEDISQDFVRGLVFCSYPLHTPDNTKALRSEILLNIPSPVPTLFISGLSDTMCKPELFNKVFKDMKSSPREVLQIQGADHGLGFGSAKGVAGKKEALAESIADWIIAFMDEHAEGAKKGADEEGEGQSLPSTTKGKATKSKASAKEGVAIKKKVEVKKAEAAGEWNVSVSTIV